MEQIYKQWIEKASNHVVIEDKALILLGDSAEILKNNTIPVDRVITDPPYEFKSQGGKLFGRDKFAFDDMRKKGLADGFDLSILDELSSADSMMVFMHNDQLFNLLGHLTQERHVECPDCANAPCKTHITGCNKFIKPPLYESYCLCGWNKTNPTPVANKNYMADTELYLHAWRSPFYPKGALDDKRRITTTKVYKSTYDHPTVKPQAIMEKCIINGSDIDDVIIDPFCGSGSTGVAALKHGRKFIGIEKDPEFYEIAKQRLGITAGVWFESINDKQQNLF